MSDKYGNNQWKVNAASMLVLIFAVVGICGILGGIYIFIKANYEAYQEEIAKQKEEWRIQEASQEAEELSRRQEEERYAAEQEESEVMEEEEEKIYVSQYEVVVSDATWDDARQQAENRGGHLATITSAEEQKTIEALIDENENLHTVWIGGVFIDGIFEWINGEPFEYTKWGSGEPNNETGDEIYLDMYEYNGIWYWNDVPNDIKEYFSGQMGYVIEWEVEQ